MTTTLKDFIGDSLVGKTFHFKCDCLFSFDIIGTIVDYEIKDNTILFSVSESQTGKLITIDLNQPNLSIDVI